MVAGRRALAYLAGAFIALVLAGSALASTSGVVISEFRFRGPAGGNDEFVELLNTSAAAVSISGWRLQGCTSGVGGTASGRATVPNGISLAAGQHYLFVNNNTSGGYSGTVPGDQTYGTGFTDGAGARITLGDATTVVDGVSGTLTAASECREGVGITGMPGSNGDNSYERRFGGTQDTDNNAGDFDGPKVGNPQNRAGTDTPPRVTETSPTGGTVDVPVDANISITFSETVAVSPGWFAIHCTTSGDHTAAVSGGPTTWTLDPDANFVPKETCTVTVFANGVSDLDTNDPPDHPLANFVFSVSTETPPTPIHEIQGAAHVSPIAGTNVSVTGIVTQKISNGFFLQAPDAEVDGDPATSEGIFVFGSRTAGLVAVGDAVRVSGQVQEFDASTDTNLPVTEIGNTALQAVLSHGNALPARVLWSPPTKVIEDDANGDVTTSGVFDPANDGLDYAESLEGMRVEIDDATVTGPSRDFTSSRTTEAPLVGPGAGLRTPRGGIVIQADDFNPERLILQATLGSITPLNVGDRLPGGTVGVIDYNFGNYKLRPSAALNVVSGGLQPEAADEAVGDQVAVATFNVENLDPSDGDAKFSRLAHILVTNLAAPDIVALEEVQDDNGATDDGTTSSNATLDTLVAAIKAAGGPTYAYRYIEPVNDQDGGEPGGNIRVAFLFRTDRGVAFVDRPGAGPLTPNAVAGNGPGTHLEYSPGRIDPTSDAWSSSRKPLAGEFTYKGHKLFVIANHFNSKGGDQPLMGRTQPAVRSSEVQRHKQAEEVKAFVGALLAADPKANVVVAGDLNDFQFSDTVSILKSTPLKALIETLPPSEQYTYDFDGNSQAIDHILVSGNLFDRSAFRYDVVHVNSEFADQASDHDPQVVRLTMARPTITASRTPPANPAGWNNTAVTVSFACDDPLSALASCPAPVTLATEGASQSVTGSSGTKAGDAVFTTVSGISIDLTKPVVSYTGNKGTYGVDETVAIACSASDALSGLATKSCADVAGPAYSFGLGTHTFAATATDLAGNTSGATVTFTVTVSGASLCGLTSQFVTKAGVAHSLCVKLEHGQVGAYQNELRAQSGKSITDGEAKILLALVQSL